MSSAVTQGIVVLPGLRAHYAQTDRVGSWEIPAFAICRASGVVRIGKARSRSR